MGAGLCEHAEVYAKGMCQRCYQADYRARNRERLAANKRAYAAANAEQENARKKAWADANADRVRANNRARYQEQRDRIRAVRAVWLELNREHDNARRRKWRTENVSHEEAAARTRAWRQANPERARDQAQRRRARLVGDNPDLTPQEWLALLQAADGVCTYCGRSDLPLTLDHVTPLSRGGRHTASNVLPCCGPCNSRKGAKSLSEFLALMNDKAA